MYVHDVLCRRWSMAGKVSAGHLPMHVSDICIPVYACIAKAICVLLGVLRVAMTRNLLST